MILKATVADSNQAAAMNIVICILVASITITAFAGDVTLPLARLSNSAGATEYRTRSENIPYHSLRVLYYINITIGTPPQHLAVLFV